LGMREPSCIARPARHFFILEAHDPQGTVIRVAMLEPFPAGRWGSVQWDMWQHRSSPWWGGEVLSNGPHGDTRAHHNRVARFRVAGRMPALEPT
jgi:hypothetical protein